MIWRRRATGGRKKPEVGQGGEASPLSTGTTVRHSIPRRPRPALPAYLLGLGTAFLLVVNSGATTPYPRYDLKPPSRVMIHKGLLTALVEAAFRTRSDEQEEFFCLIGVVDDQNVYWITGSVRPRQRAETFKAWWKNAAVVFHGNCPPGTLADLHTHPWVSDISHLMSEQDKKAGRAVPYFAHVILFPGSDGQIYAATWVRQPDGSYKTIPQG